MILARGIGYAALALVCVLSIVGCGAGSPTPTFTPLSTRAADPTATPGSTPTDNPTATPHPTMTETPPSPTHTPVPSEEETPMATATERAAGGGNADVIQVRAVENADGRWTFYVTVEHPDTGWEDYADGWDVVLPDGTVVKPDPESPFTRLLLHPHTNEQPFTRSQSGIVLPEGVTEVRVRAHDLVDGYGGQEVTVDLTADSGPNFEVERP